MAGFYGMLLSVLPCMAACRNQHLVGFRICVVCIIISRILFYIQQKEIRISFTTYRHINICPNLFLV